MKRLKITERQAKILGLLTEFIDAPSLGSTKSSDKPKKKSSDKEESEDPIKKETIELIKYLYRKSEELSPFWAQNDLNYDAICDTLLSKKLIVKKGGAYVLSKKSGNPQAAVQAVEDALRPLIKPQSKETPQLETEDDNLDAYKLDTPPSEEPTEPRRAKNPSLRVVADTGEMAILNGPDGTLYLFNYFDIPKKDFAEFASQTRTFAGTGPDGKKEYDYSDDFIVDIDVISHYVNEMLSTLSKGVGIEGYESGAKLITIDEPLKQAIIDLHDKNPTVVQALSPIDEASEPEAMDSLKSNIKTGFVDSNKPKPEQSAIVAKLQQLKAQEAARREAEKRNTDLEEMTSSASSGAFTAPMSMPVVKREIPTTPVVAESNKLGHGYTHFAIFKKDGKIANGWDFKGLYDKYSKSYDNESIKDYTKTDIRDDFPEMKLSDFKVVTRKGLEKNGIDPSNSNNWFKLDSVQDYWPENLKETDVASAGNFQYDTPGGLTMDLGKSNPKTKAEKTPQWAGGSFVKQPECSKLNNNKSAQKGGCNQGASSLKTVKGHGSINAPSLGEGLIYEALKLQYDKANNSLIILSDLEGKAASQETFKNKNVLNKNGFKWTGNNWAISADKLDIAKQTLSLINKAEYLIDKLEDVEEMVMSSGADNKSLLKARLDQYISDLANATDEAALSAEIRRYLTFFSKFHNYSFYNKMLIYIQRPEATRVASYKTWESKFRQVQKGAKGITILAPIITKKPEAGAAPEEPRESNIRGFRAVNVFDIADTKPIDERGETPETPQWWGNNEPSETADMLFKAVSEVASDMGISVTQGQAHGGEKGFSAGDHINITSDVQGAGRLSTMIHEIAHELMHWKTSSIYYQGDEVKYDAAIKELQAESVSYVVLKHYGLPVSHHTTYLALWKANKEKIQSNLEVISKVAEFIIKKIEEEINRGQGIAPSPEVAPELTENEIYETIAKKTGKSIDAIKKIIDSKKTKA